MAKMVQMQNWLCIKEDKEHDMIYELENKMWQAAKDGNKAEFARLVSADAVMVCGG